jgi:hypothetical protein
MAEMKIAHNIFCRNLSTEDVVFEMQSKFAVCVRMGRNKQTVCLFEWIQAA